MSNCLKQPKRPLRLRLGSDLKPPLYPIGYACEEEKKHILKTLDLIILCDDISNYLLKRRWSSERYDKIEHIKIKKRRLQQMIKRRTWDNYNECARKFSTKKEIDIVESLFERLAGIALGEEVDQTGSAKYVVLLLNTIFDEQKELAAHPGFRPKLSTIEEINEASALAMELLLEGSISMEVAERFHKLLSARVELLESSVQSHQLNRITDFMEKVERGEIKVS